MAMRSIRPMPGAVDSSAALIGAMNREMRQLRNVVANKRENYLNLTKAGWEMSVKEAEQWTHYKNRIV